MYFEQTLEDMEQPISKEDMESIRKEDMEPISKEEMEEHMENKSTNYGFTTLTPATTDEAKRMDKWLDTLSKIFKEIKPNNKPIGFPKKLVTKNVEISDDIKNFFEPTISQKGGVRIFTAEPYSATDILQRFLNLRRPNQTAVLIFRQIMPGTDLDVKHEQTFMINGNRYDMDMYMYTSTNARLESVTPFVQKFIHPDPNHPFNNINETYITNEYPQGALVYAPNETIIDATGPLQFFNTTPMNPNEAVLSDYILMDGLVDRFNVGFIQPHVTAATECILNQKHTRSDIRTQKCITRRWDTIVNPWLQHEPWLGGANETRWDTDTRINKNLTQYLSEGRCIVGPNFNLDMTQDGRMNVRYQAATKVQQINNFMNNKGRMTNEDHSVIYNPVGNPAPLNANCQVLRREAVVFRGMKRRLTPEQAPANFEAGVYYKHKQFIHCSLDANKAIEFARFVGGAGAPQVDPAGRIVYRIQPKAGIPYFTFDNTYLQSDYEQECEIVFPDSGWLRVLVPARQLGGIYGTLLVEDVELSYENDRIREVCDAHRALRRGVKPVVYTEQFNTVAEIMQFFANCVAGVAQVQGGKRTNKRRTLKKHKRHTSLKKHKRRRTLKTS